MRADAHDHRGGILRGPAFAAAMFPNDFCIAQVHRDARAKAIPAGVFLGRSRGPIAADEAEGDHAALAARPPAFRCGRD